MMSDEQANDGQATTRALDPTHLQELRASGIPDELIREAGIYSAENAEIRELLGWQPRSHDWGRGMVIPFPTAEGGRPYCRVKLDYPRAGDNGKPIKYESPRNRENRAYLPPGLNGQLGTASVLLITEGEKKALAAAGGGFACIGLVGVWGWQRRRLKDDQGKAYGVRELIPDLYQLPWKGRDVVIAFDSDAEENYLVRLAEARLAEALAKRGATVRVARLPQLGDGKTGLDDFLVHYGDEGPAKLQGLLDAAQPAESPEKLGPMILAKALVEEAFTHALGVRIRWHREEFRRWTGTHYVKIERKELEARVLAWLDQRITSPTPHLATDVVKCLESLCVLPSEREPPFWITHGKSMPVPEHIIALRNGLLDITEVGGELRMTEHTPDYYVFSYVPYAFDPDASCPEWERFVHSSLDGDEERIRLLQKWFGLLLTRITRYQKLLLMLGPSRSGKGTIIRMILALLGSDACTSPTFSSLDSDFGLWPLLGKQVAAIPDAHLGRRADAARILETIKSIVGEDPQNINRKYLTILQGVRLSVRFVISVNELPHFYDPSGALLARISLLRFQRSFAGQEDRGLEDRLKAEAPGVLNWALRGLPLLHREGFHVPETSVEVLQDFNRLASPVAAFVEECCEVGAGLSERTELVYAAWREWAKANGHGECSAAMFGTRLQAVDSRIEKKRQRTGEVGEREYRYLSIRLSDAGRRLICP